MTEKHRFFVVVTPAGTPILYGHGALIGRALWGKTEQEAIDNLLRDAADMPYETWDNFQARGYSIHQYEDV